MSPVESEHPRWRIIEGDCRDALGTLPAGSIHTCVTSPPYFGLRDYGHDGQIGLESTPDEFVGRLVEVFREVRRVLRDDGTVWLNLGDSYAAGKTGRADHGSGDPTSRLGPSRDGLPNGTQPGPVMQRSAPDGMKPKDLLGIPWMVAFALRADGWYLRSDIIWSKPNPMPESVTDRPTKAHEYLFLLTKSPRYFYDADAIREPHAEKSLSHRGGGGMGKSSSQDELGKVASGNLGDMGYVRRLDPRGVNKRTVWTVAPQPYPGAHFATFPPKLIEPCILAGAPERACGECGAPWVRVVEQKATLENGRHVLGLGEKTLDVPGKQPFGAPTLHHDIERRTLGFEPSCEHGDGSATGVVLDPFAGAGTTGVVALRHGRDFVGIELNAEYADLARPRLERYWRDEPRPADAPQLDSLFTLGDAA